MTKPNVLWIGLEQFSFPLNETSDEKYKILSEHYNSYVLSCSKDRKFRHEYVNSTNFHLIPLLGKLIYLFPYYIGLLFVMTPYLIIRKKIDVVIASDPFIPGLVSAFWKRILFWKKLGLVVEAFGNWTETPVAPLPKVLRWPVRIIIKGSSYFSISAADALRAESMVTLNKLKSYTKKDLPSDQFNLMHMELFDNININAEEHPNEYRMLIIGRVVKLKGIQYLLDVLNELRDNYPELRLYVGGDGEYLENLQIQSERLGVNTKTIFLGNLSRQQVKEQLANCDVFVLPSMSEGRPRVLIEAMAIGKPMIASDVGAINEIVVDRKNGFLIDPYNISQLKDKIKWCLDNKEEAKRMGIEENSKLLGNFGDRFTIKGWGRLYTNLINKTYESVKK